MVFTFNGKACLLRALPPGSRSRTSCTEHKADQIWRLRQDLSPSYPRLRTHGGVPKASGLQRRFVLHWPEDSSPFWGRPASAWPQVFSTSQAFLSVCSVIRDHSLICLLSTRIIIPAFFVVLVVVFAGLERHEKCVCKEGSHLSPFWFAENPIWVSKDTRLGWVHIAVAGRRE